MNLHKFVAFFILLAVGGLCVPPASAIPVSLSVDPDIPLGSDWNVLSGGGYIDLPCATANDLTGGPRHVSVGLSGGEVDVYEFGFNFGFNGAIQGGCFGEAYLNPVGSTIGELYLLGYTDNLLWINGSTQIIEFDTFELYDPDFLYVLDDTRYILPRGFSIPAPPVVWLISLGLTGFLGMARRNKT
jgi:hypothetical protein